MYSVITEKLKNAEVLHDIGAYDDKNGLSDYLVHFSQNSEAHKVLSDSESILSNILLHGLVKRFYVSAVQVFRKRCGKKEKLLVLSNFSFSHGVFYLFGELLAIFIKF